MSVDHQHDNYHYDDNRDHQAGDPQAQPHEAVTPGGPWVRPVHGHRHDGKHYGGYGEKPAAEEAADDGQHQGGDVRAGHGGLGLRGGLGGGDNHVTLVTSLGRVALVTRLGRVALGVALGRVGPLYWVSGVGVGGYSPH